MSFFLKRWFGRAGIFLTAVWEYLRYEFPRLDVEIDGRHYPATFAVVCNSKHYAGDWIVAPEASVETDVLDTVLFNSRSRRDLLSFFRGMKARDARHLKNGYATVVRGRNVRVTSLEDYPVEAQVDGDCVLETPIECRISLRTLTVLAPKS